MYQYYINSNDTVFGGVTPAVPITNNLLVSIYNEIHNTLFTTYHSWQQDTWSNIIIAEGLHGNSCLHDNLLYFNIAKDMIWDMILLKLHIPTANKDDILTYYGVEDKAIFLNKYNIDLYRMVDCVSSYLT